MDLIQVQKVVNAYFADRKELFNHLKIQYRVVHGNDIYTYMYIQGNKREIRVVFPCGCMQEYVINTLKHSLANLIMEVLL